MIIGIKLTGAMCILGSCGYLAYEINGNQRKRLSHMKMLYSILIQMKSQLNYLGETLPECFSHLAEGTRAPFTIWLEWLGRELTKDGQELDFATIWLHSLDELLQATTLIDEDIVEMKELALKLGSGDQQLQQKGIDYVIVQLDRKQKQLEAELKQKGKVVTTLTMFVGVVTLILLL